MVCPDSAFGVKQRVPLEDARLVQGAGRATFAPLVALLGPSIVRAFVLLDGDRLPTRFDFQLANQRWAKMSRVGTYWLIAHACAKQSCGGTVLDAVCVQCHEADETSTLLEERITFRPEFEKHYTAMGELQAKLTLVLASHEDALSATLTAGTLCDVLTLMASLRGES